MKLSAWDPDLETLFTRIEKGDLNLQPDFQRGEVWSKPKQQKLIDTILRGWHVPPVHVVVDPSSERQEVLDGQQRLAAVRDFISGKFSVNGNCQPFDEELFKLNGCKYSNLPVAYKRRFDSYSIRVIRITDYKTDEPGELFHRLNQPANLTAAEQRNALYGPIRTQVKEIVSQFKHWHLTEETLGFPNSRMAYDDIVARVCFTIKNRSLRIKVTSGQIADFYRLQDSLDSSTLTRVTTAFQSFGQATRDFLTPIRFNKATFYSWTIFSAEYIEIFGQISTKGLGLFINDFESARQSAKSTTEIFRKPFHRFPQQLTTPLLDIFNDRSSARVADVSSVCARDLILWLFAYSSQFTLETPRQKHVERSRLMRTLFAEYSTMPSSEQSVTAHLDSFINAFNWGSHV